jgi:hypothetical protein
MAVFLDMYWFNPQLKSVTLAGNPTLTATVVTELGTSLRVPFVTFSSRMVQIYYGMQFFTNTVANQDNSFFIGLDSSLIVTVPTASIRNGAALGSESYNVSNRIDTTSITEGRHYTTAYGVVSGGAVGVSLWSNTVSIYG